MKYVARFLLAILCLSVYTAAWSYPTKPIRVIIPFSAGGPSDVIGRLFAEQLREALQNSVIVENKVGGGTSIGTAEVARSAPDGHTMIIVSTMTMNSLPFLRKDLPYSVEDDLTMVNYFASTPMIMLVRPDFPVKDLAEFVSYAKANPNKINYGSSGNGQAYHLAAELLALEANIKMTHIPYKGSAPTLTDLVGGNIQMAFDSASAPLSFIADKRLKALGITGKERLPQLPDVPTLMEQGIPNYFMELNWGVFVPRKTDPEIVAKLNRIITEMAGKDTVIKALDGLALRPNSCKNTDECERAVHGERKRIGDLIQKIGLEPM